MKASCLCGIVAFEIEGDIPNVYQCHCSLCRKATGAAANAATIVERAAFRWTGGESDIRSYSKPSGFRSDFCSVCGSPVPNRLGNSDLMWIPVGLLDDHVRSRIAVHPHTKSAAGWETESDGCIRLEHGPESLEALSRLLQTD